jgi:Protein of unknown function (DUF1153)
VPDKEPCGGVSPAQCAIRATIKRQCRIQNYAVAGSRCWQRKFPVSERSFGPANRVNSVIEETALQVTPMEDLPPPNTTRWVIRRKAAVVAAVRSGRITMEEALLRYQLSEEEFVAWQRAFETHGLAGLRATRVRQYGGPRPPPAPRSRS